MLPTPDTSHLNFTNIYPPSEDSYLLLDTLSSASETRFLHQRFSARSSPDTPLILEAGTGSGVVLAFIARNAHTLFGRNDALSLGTDVNAFACAGAAETVRRSLLFDEGNDEEDRREQEARRSSAFLGCIQGDLATSLKGGCVDVLVFNPPYVPSESLPLSVPQHTSSTESTTREEAFQRDNHLLALATDGGADGMEVTWRLLNALPDVLSERGVAYVLLCARNRPAQVREWVEGWGGGWMCITAGESGGKGGWERLVVVRIWREVA